MYNKLIKLTESDVRKIVNKCIRRIINESYRGTLYHFTTLPSLYWILQQNNLIGDYSDEFCDYRKGTYDREYDEPYKFICFTRDKNYNIRKSGVVCRLAFDSEKLMQLRNARLYPVNWSRKPKINNANEAEERLWDVNIYPLDKYLERIDIIINDLSNFDDGCNDYVDELYDRYYDSYYAKYPDAEDKDFSEFLAKKLIEKIMRIKKFKGKINLTWQ